MRVHIQSLVAQLNNAGFFEEIHTDLEQEYFFKWRDPRTTEEERAILLAKVQVLRDLMTEYSAAILDDNGE